MTFMEMIRGLVGEPSARDWIAQNENAVQLAELYYERTKTAEAENAELRQFKASVPWESLHIALDFIRVAQTGQCTRIKWADCDAALTWLSANRPKPAPPDHD